DGTTGEVFLGEVPVVASPVVRYFEGDETAADDELVAAVDRITRHAVGARGIGLCRTEHMSLGERRQLVERLILADTDEEQTAELAELLPLQRTDFVGVLEAMDGLPVTIRL